MTDESRAAFSERFSPQLTRWLAFGWATVIAFIWLFQYEAAQFWPLLVDLLPAPHLGSHFGEFWIARLKDAGTVAGILATAFAVGAIVVRRLTKETGLLTGLFAIALGFWIMAVTVLVMGASSIAHVRWTFVFLLCWAHPAPRSLIHWRRGERWDGWSRFLLCLIVVAALINLPGALAPPFEYDELEYHLGALTEYGKAGKIVVLPHNFYSNMPQLTEMLYLLGSDVAAKLLHWAFGLLTAAAIYALGTRLWSRRAGITAAALFYCLPFVQDLSQTARIDLATTFFATLAFGALMLDWRALAALATGCAIATKWPAVAVVLLPALVLLLIETKSLKPVMSFAVLACIPVAPWLVKNLVFTGNPIYPLLFGGANWSQSQAALFAAKHAPSFDGAGLLQLIERVWRYSFVEPGATPLLLMSAPLLFLFRSQNCRRLVWLFVLAYLGWYFTTFRPWRFLMPVLPLAALMGGRALTNWSRPAVVAVLLTGLAAMSAGALVDVGNSRQVPARVSFLTHALGQQSREEFIVTIGNEMLEPIIWMNHNLPANARVLYIGEARTHYARHDVLWATAYDQHPVLRPSAGITHVYINFSEWQRLSANYDYLSDLDNGAFRRWLQEHGQIIHTNHRNQVWAIE